MTEELHAIHEPLAVDMDRHVLEPVGMWREYLPASAAALAPRLVPLVPPDLTWAERLRRFGDHALLPIPNVLCVGDRPIWADLPDVAHVELALTANGRTQELLAGASTEGHLANMDCQGIGLGVVLPTYASYLVHDDGVDALTSRLYAQAYNRFMSDFVAGHARRLCAPILLSRHDPQKLAADLEQALRARLAPVVIRPNPVGGKTLSDTSLEPFWSLCAEASLPVLVHEGTHAHVQTAGRERFGTRFGKHACSHPMEMMMALLSLIEGGVLERHPRLRVCFLEAGCGWLPYWLWRLDEIEYRNLRGEVSQHVRRPPSEYFRRQCWVAAEAGEPLLDRVVDALGSDRVVAGTDFPHLDHDGDPLSGIRKQCSGLGRAVVERVLWQNAHEVLGELAPTPAEPQR
jgi:predicted TIM-barrel fold metal-dependent hydrolase